nr:HipA domain-containing protein [Rhodoglobus vestalii]
MEAGTSAGGARPKAIVRHKGELWMAKFARETEFSEPMAWEATALALARRAGVQTPEFELVRLTESRSILLTRRFDRENERRVGYISAHSLTTKNDHFRNHGFLRRHDGWTLSPVFDLEPDRRPEQVEATPIVNGGEQFGRDIRELRDCHDIFRLTPDDAEGIIRDVADRTADWIKIANDYGISREAAEASKRALAGPNRDRALAMAPDGSQTQTPPPTRRSAQKRRGDLGMPGNSGQWARKPS